MFVADRESARKVFFEAWRKRCAGQPLEPLELQVAEVIARHPEYQSLFAREPMNETVGEYNAAEGKDNPFLHMGLHLAVQEQVATDRPSGIADIHRVLCIMTGDPHEAEHRMMDRLAEALWEAQSAGAMPDEQSYLEQLRGLLT